LDGEGIKLVNVGASDIETCNPKIILGLLWKIIYKFQIANFNVQKGQKGDDDASQGLLKWAQNSSSNYGVPIDNFKSSFKDGKAISALVDSLQPGSIDLKKTGDPLTATKRAMDIAERSHGVKKLLDPEDVVENPDPHSIMLYVATLREASAGKKPAGAPGTLAKKSIAPAAAVAKELPKPLPRAAGRYAAFSEQFRTGKKWVRPTAPVTKTQEKKAYQKNAPRQWKPPTVSDRKDVQAVKKALNDKGLVQTGFTDAQIEQALKKGRDVNNTLDILEHLRTPGSTGFPSVRSLIKCFDRVAAEQEKIKGQMLQWLQRKKKSTCSRTYCL